MSVTHQNLKFCCLVVVVVVWVVDRAQCSWSQVSAFQHYSNLPLASSLSQPLYSSPRPYPTFGSNPSSLPPTTLCPRLPPPHPLPPLIPPGPPGPFQWHSLSTTCTSISLPRPPPTLVPSFTVSPVPLPSVIHPPDQCRPRTLYPAVSLKCWVILGGSSSRTDANIFVLHYFIK